MIFTKLSCDFGTAFIDSTAGNGESADPITRAMRGILGEISIENWSIHNYFLVWFRSRDS
jgi:hypothetical protein